MYSKRPKTTGAFVWTFDELGLGQIESIQNGACTLSFFKSANESFECSYDLASVEPAYLPQHTRAFVRSDAGAWTIGRVIDAFREEDGLHYEIQFPNKVSKNMLESDIRFRCHLPNDDPASVLGAGGIETQYLHDRRRTALACLSESRAANYGLTGLLSASVELLPHQVDVVRRVLNDNLQRYLLADEVGLGKTIEACAIIRQAIMDNPSEKVVVLAPTPLTAQWMRELSWRFFIDFPEHDVRILPYEDLQSIDPSNVDTLVIDEAHNLISDDPSADGDYKAIESLSSHAHRLLLISATPVLGNERTLLALLHLLDPQNYRLDDEVAFLEKVQNSQQFGRLLLALDPNQPPAFLRSTLDLIIELTPSDKASMELVTNINQSIADGRNELIPEYVKSLHRHISETYRIHQRLIRTRRRDLVDGGMNDRQSVFHTFAEDEDDRSPKLVDLLDVWRIHSLEGLENTSEANRSEYELRMAERYAALHEALGISVEKYEEELTKQIDDIKQGRELTFDQDEYDLTIARDVTQEHTEFTRLDMAASLVRTAIDRIASITPQPKIVAFSSSTEFASELADSLGYQLICKVFRVNQFSTDEEVQEAYTGFASSREAAVLVCDQRGEEGLNLQFAQGIVHLDLPLMPDRIEQRIGRLDRVGRKELNRASSAFTQDIHYWVLSPFHDTVHPWERWHELLRDGFKVFEQSISEVQFLLDDLHLTVKLALYRRGSAGLKDLENNILESIAQERERLDEQYALDSRSIISEDTNDAFTEIVKTDSPVHFRPLNNWLTRVLQVGRFSIDGLPTCFEYKWLDQTLLPKINPRQVIDPESFNGKLTYNRSVAAFTRGIRLVRPGLELVDQIEDYLMTCDDRGTAFATWKTDPEWTGEGRSQWLGFRLTFLLEANIDTAVSKLNQIIGDLQTTSLRRRMDSLLPPWSTTLYVDIDMKPVKDILLSDILERPYSSNRDSFGRRDFNLGSRLDVLYDAIGYDELASACDKAKETSELILRGSDEFQEWVMSHAERAIHQTKADSERLTRRQEVVIRETGTADSWIERDIVLNSGIISALGEPSVRLDSIGLFVVSDKDPNQEGMGT